MAARLLCLALGHRWSFDRMLIGVRGSLSLRCCTRCPATRVRGYPK